MLKKDDRTSIFIDGANFFSQSKLLGVDIDYSKLLKLLEDSTNLIRAYYYTAIDYDYGHVKIMPLLDYLVFNGYDVVTKPVKRFSDDFGNMKRKGNMDIEIVIDVVEQCKHLDNVILATGDGDFDPLIKYIKRGGCRATVLSSLRNGMTSEDIRRSCDYFMNLDDIINSIAMNRSH